MRNSLAQRRLSLCRSAELRLRMLFSLREVLVVLWGSGRDNVANLHLIFFKKSSPVFSSLALSDAVKATSALENIEGSRPR